MNLLVTGSSGLIGSEVAAHFAFANWDVHGVDKNQRAVFFGPEGDNRFNQTRLQSNHRTFRHHELDIRDRGGMLHLLQKVRPDAIVHAAAQPSHDLSAGIPFEDFDTNAAGTLNVLEAARRHAKNAPFVFLSTNKVYGDTPNRIALVERETRWDFCEADFEHGIPETLSIDQSQHSPFGASKLAADIMVQEYGTYFGMPTCCLRAGCMTGPAQSGVELHGFLSYLVRCNLERRRYRVFGYKGKQVRDNIHSSDVARFIETFVSSPRIGAVYNLGGGKANSCSILEAFERVSTRTGIPMQHDYVSEHRKGDHICYYSDLRKLRADYPGWDVRVGLDDIFDELVTSWRRRIGNR